MLGAKGFQQFFREPEHYSLSAVLHDGHKPINLANISEGEITVSPSQIWKGMKLRERDPFHVEVFVLMYKQL